MLAATALALALSPWLLAGCGTDGPLTFAPPGAGPATAASAPGGPSSATVASSASSTVKVGNKSVEISGGVFDPNCTQLVAPFDLTDNLGELSRFGLSRAAESVGAYVGQQVQQMTGGGSGTRASASAAAQPLGPDVRRAALRMNWLPMAVEERYGQYLLEQMRSAGQLMPRDGKVGGRTYPKAEALLAEVLDGVTEPHAYKFEVFVSTEPGENAMALPGGKVVLDKALLDRPELRDKARFAVSHEIGHVLQRHQTRALQARAVDAMALKGSLPDMVRTMRSAGSEPQAVVQLLVGGKLLFEKHSEQQELQADACGMRVLDKGNASNAQLLAAVQAFARSLPRPKPAAAPTAPGGANNLEALAALVEVVQRPVDAHPSTEDRLKNLDRMLAELSQRPGAKLPAKSPPAKQQNLPTLPVRKAG